MEEKIIHDNTTKSPNVENGDIRDGFRKKQNEIKEMINY